MKIYSVAWCNNDLGFQRQWFANKRELPSIKREVRECGFCKHLKDDDFIVRQHQVKQTKAAVLRFLNAYACNE